MFQRSFSRNRNNTRNRWHSPMRAGKPGNGSFRYANRGRSSISSSRYIKNAAVPGQIEEYIVKNQFSNFPINEQIKSNISARGYKIPTPIQDQVIPHVLEGRDVVGIANTGTGKTGAFLIPLIDKILKNPSEKILIMAPTRELAAQINDELKVFAAMLPIKSLLCIGGSNLRMQASTLRQNPNIIIGTPGRLKDLANRRILKLNEFQTVVLDEVDRMVDIGFIHDIRQILGALSPSRQSLFFSATVSGQIAGIIATFLKNPVTVSVKKQETAQNVEQNIVRVKSQNEKYIKLEELLRLPEFTKVLVFGRTKWGVEKLAHSLRENGFSVGAIHGNKTQGQRIAALSQFKTDKLRVLVATDIAARGLDINDVSHVINYDEPQTYDDYVHRIGRTGRADKAGKALTFVI